MSEEEQGGFAVGNPESWKEALPDVKGVGVIEEFCIRDGNPSQRFPRPIRQLNVRVRRLNAVWVNSDGEESPMNIYAGANLERQVNDQEAPGGKKLVWAAKGKNKVNHMISNWTKAGLPMQDLVLDSPVDGQGTFIPLPTESWVSPRDGETKTENRTHVEACEGIKIEYVQRRRMAFGGGNEAHDVLEITKILPPDYEHPEEDIEKIVLREEGEGSDSPPDSSNAFDGGGGGAPAVDETAGDLAVAQALDGKKREEAMNVLLELPEEYRVEPYITGLSEEGAPLVDDLIEKELLKVMKSGKLKFIGEADE